MTQEADDLTVNKALIGFSMDFLIEGSLIDNKGSTVLQIAAELTKMLESPMPQSDLETALFAMLAEGTAISRTDDDGNTRYIGCPAPIYTDEDQKLLMLYATKLFDGGIEDEIPEV